MALIIGIFVVGEKERKRKNSEKMYFTIVSVGCSWFANFSQ